MFKRKDDIRTLIVISIVCVICVIIGLILSHKSNYDKLENVNEYNIYFDNVNYVNDFITKIASNDKEAVYSLLSNEYIEYNNITINNVIDNFDEFSIQSSFSPSNMYYLKIKNNYLYYINGTIYENVYDGGRRVINNNYSIIIIKDNKNSSYSLYPVSDSNYKDIINNIKKIKIIKNDYNVINEDSIITDEQICSMYLSNFIDNVYYNIDNSYEFLSDKMKEKYIDVSGYNKYILDNINLLSTMADKCKKDEYDDERVYTVIDMNKNVYIFTESYIMNYKVDFYLNANNK